MNPCSYGCLDPECDACVSSPAPRKGVTAKCLTPYVGCELRAIGTLATVAGLFERLGRELVRVAERLRP
jgi:hypothetical protein